MILQHDLRSGLSTSSLPIFKEHMYSHLICPVCHQLFKNPKHLPCHHSYCEECLEKIQGHSKVTCAECRNEVIVPTGGVKDLPNNYFLNHLVNKLIFDHKLIGETQSKCEECNEDDPAVVYCTDCKLFLCCYCKESHKYSKSYCSHNLLSLTEIRSNKDHIQSRREFPTCQEHDLELEYYCESCEKLVCVQCTGEHEGHKYDVVKKFANRYHNELKILTAPIEVMIEDLSKTSNAIDEMKTAIKQQGDEISEEIDLYYEKVFKQLLKQKEQVKQQVHETVSQKVKAVTMQLEEVMCTQEKILNIKRIRDALQTNCDQELVSAKDQLTCSMKKLKERCKEIGARPIESANVTVTPVNEPLLQVVKHFATIDSLSFELKDFNNSLQQGQTAMLEIITKDSKGNDYPRGRCEVTVELKSRMGEIISTQVMDYNDGTYMICFKPQQVGEIDLSVFVNKCKIQGSPFRIVVQENLIKPSKIITSHDDSFGQLWGIACSNNGMWAVADWVENCVHVFDSQDKLIKRFGGQGSKNGQFEYPCDVAFDDNNDLYVTDSHNHRVQKFDTHSNYILQFGGKGVNKGKLKYPIGISTHSDKVYVADRRNNRISVFQDNGEFCTVIGQQQLSQYFEVAVDIYGELVVADWRHQCIYIFTLDGHCTNTFTMKGGGLVQLREPCSVTTGSNGLILIADTYNHCVSIFDDEIGNCMYCFGSKGSDDGKFNHPHGIAVGPNGNIYISDTGNKRVQIFSNRLM